MIYAMYHSTSIPLREKHNDPYANRSNSTLYPDNARGGGGDMSHFCHHPGCTKTVPPKMWGCKHHWFRLPKALRDKVWATYRPGQEVRKDPSAAYLAVADEVQQWCRENP